MYPLIEVRRRAQFVCDIADELAAHGLKPVRVVLPFALKRVASSAISSEPFT